MDSALTGSLATVRNLYKSMAADTTWFDFSISVRSRNITIAVNGVDVVCYTEPGQIFRTEENAGRRLSSGRIVIRGDKGTVKFRGLEVTPLAPGTVNPCDTMPPVDETVDQIIRLQQRNFPGNRLSCASQGWSHKGDGSCQVHELRYKLWCSSKCR